jgi:hypothetical protein
MSAIPPVPPPPPALKNTSKPGAASGSLDNEIKNFDRSSLRKVDPANPHAGGVPKRLGAANASTNAAKSGGFFGKLKGMMTGKTGKMMGASILAYGAYDLAIKPLAKAIFGGGNNSSAGSSSGSGGSSATSAPGSNLNGYA